MNTKNQWDNAALSYMKDQERSEFAAGNRQIVKKRFQKLNGKTVLDLGCGYGFFAGYFKSIGADVLGVDGSEMMLKLAREHYPECNFQLADLNQPLALPGESFDLIFCNLVLMDVEHVAHLFSECGRLLRKNGILYYTINHPAFYNGDWLRDNQGFYYAKAIGNYIRPCRSENNFWGKTAHFHRPLSYYLNAASASGLTLIHAEEPVSYNGKTKNADLPLFFIAEYQK